MKRLTLLLLLLTTMTGCAPWWGDDVVVEREEYPNIPALEYIVVSYSDELERYKRLFLSDSRAFYDHYVEFIWMKLRTQAVMDLYEARDLIVYVVEGLLERINMDPVVSRDLYNYPFDAKNLIIEIEFDSFNQYIDARTIARVHMHENDVHYYASDALDPDTVWYHQRCEPYDKAYRFSKFKSYRPWLKKPPQENFEFKLLDVSQAGGGGGSSSGGGGDPYAPPPPKRPPLQKSQKQTFTNFGGSNTPGTPSSSSSLPGFSVQGHSY